MLQFLRGGSPRIAGELGKLGIDVAESMVERGWVGRQKLGITDVKASLYGIVA